VRDIDDEEYGKGGKKNGTGGPGGRLQ